MSHSINYHFTGIPTGILTQACCDLKNSGNALSVFITIVKNILQFPEGRKTLRKELSLRFIGEQLKMHFANVHKAIKKLVKKGYIKIIEIGTDGIGSIIELIIPDLKPENEGVVKDTTPESQPVVKDTTNEMLVNSTTKNNNLLKNLTNKNPERFVSSCKDNDKIETINEKITENIPKAPRKPLEAKPEEKLASITVKESNDFKAPVDTQIKGISEKVLSIGIQALKERGITETEKALQEIENEMTLRGKIKYPENYFISLCQKKNNWQNIVKKTETDKETRQEMKERQKQEIKDREKEEKERMAIIEENLQYNKLAEDLQEKFPAEFRAAFKEVEIELRRKKIFDCLPSFVKNQYAVEVFRVMFPDEI